MIGRLAPMAARGVTPCARAASEQLCGPHVDIVRCGKRLRRNADTAFIIDNAVFVELFYSSVCVCCDAMMLGGGMEGKEYGALHAAAAAAAGYAMDHG